MNMKRWVWVLAIVSVIAGAQVLAASRDEADAVTASQKEFEQGMHKMHEQMMIDYTGNTDVDFATGMIPHHAGAIDMAKVELKYGTDPEIRKLAEDIIAAQEKEIAFMQAWLKKHASK